MKKLDLTKRYKEYYIAQPIPEIIEIEPAHFLSICGKGNPSGKEFSETIQALYSTAYTIKFTYKAQGKDFIVPKLECLWWYDEARFKDVPMQEAPAKVPRSEWEYRLLIRMPEFITSQDIMAAKITVYEKKKLGLSSEVEYFKANEGRCVQMLHVGPFDTEMETLTKMQEFISKHQFKKNGVHHEIYLSDFTRTAPEKLRTILREPVR